LPLPQFPATRAERLKRIRRVRDLRWHPEQFATSSDIATKTLIDKKKRRLDEQPTTRAARRARYRELLHLTEALRPAVAGEIAAAESELSHCEQGLAANEILARRDYSFVLFPEEMLRDFFARLS
jgi:hypothetical protein